MLTQTVYVARGFPWMKALAALVLVLWLFHTYFVAPLLRGIDQVTPWEGAVPFIACGAPEAARPATGFPAMWYDLGAGVRSLAAGPPSQEQMVGWFRSAGTSTAASYHAVKAGAEGRARPLGLAPEPASPSPSSPAPTTDVGVFVKAIVEQESGGSYDAVGPRTRWGHAYGKYQVLETNIVPWSQQYLGRSVSVEEFHRTPEIQDRIATARLAELHLKHGPRGAASAWYSGDPDKHMSTAPQSGGPSIKGYVDSVMGHMTTIGAADTVEVCSDPQTNVMLASQGPERQQLADFILSQVGDPYVWGGTGPNGWDCSGLLWGAYKEVGKPLKVRTAAQMWAQSDQIPAEQAQAGDIVFSDFGNGRGGVREGPGHMMIALGGGQAVEAPRTGLNVRIRSVPEGAKFFRLKPSAFQRGTAV